MDGNLPQQKCPYCKTAALASSLMAHCGAMPCRMAWQKQQQAEVADRRKEEGRAHVSEMEHRFEEWCEQSHLSKEKAAWLSVPYYGGELTEVSLDHREAFLEHVASLASSLERVDEETKVTSPHEIPKHDNVTQFLPEFCALCNGHCCNQGRAHHSFIQRHTLLRVLKTRENVAVEDLVGLYEEKIPEQSVEGSCIYHTTTGCCLSADLRADICDEFFCLGVTQFLEKYEEKEAPEQVLVFSSDDNTIMRSKTLGD